MKTLVVEDDFTSRKILQKVMSAFGDCDVAASGKEAVEAFQDALRQNERYDLICLDVMMPEMDGHAVLNEIRRIEQKASITLGNGVKIIMTTALSDHENVMKAFKEQCDAYLVKPIDRVKLQKHLAELGLITLPK